MIDIKKILPPIGKTVTVYYQVEKSGKVEKRVTYGQYLTLEGGWYLPTLPTEKKAGETIRLLAWATEVYTLADKALELN